MGINNKFQGLTLVFLLATQFCHSIVNGQYGSGWLDTASADADEAHRVLFNTRASVVGVVQDHQQQQTLGSNHHQGGLPAGNYMARPMGPLLFQPQPLAASSSNWHPFAEEAKQQQVDAAQDTAAKDAICGGFKVVEERCVTETARTENGTNNGTTKAHNATEICKELTKLIGPAATCGADADSLPNTLGNNTSAACSAIHPIVAGNDACAVPAGDGGAAGMHTDATYTKVCTLKTAEALTTLCPKDGNAPGLDTGKPTDGADKPNGGKSGSGASGPAAAGSAGGSGPAGGDAGTPAGGSGAPAGGSGAADGGGSGAPAGDASGPSDDTSGPIMVIIPSAAGIGGGMSGAIDGMMSGSLGGMSGGLGAGMSGGLGAGMSGGGGLEAGMSGGLDGMSGGLNGMSGGLDGMSSGLGGSSAAASMASSNSAAGGSSLGGSLGPAHELVSMMNLMAKDMLKTDADMCTTELVCTTEPVCCPPTPACDVC